MKAFTIGIGDEWQELARHSCNQVEKHIGLKPTIITKKIDDSLSAHQQKFLLPTLTNETIFYFDADWFIIRDWNPREYEYADFAAVEDAGSGFGWVARDRIKYEMFRYFNSGLFICGDHSILSNCLKLKHITSHNESFDQTKINYSCKEKGSDITWLPYKYNTSPNLYVERDVVGLHWMGNNVRWILDNVPKWVEQIRYE